MSYTIITRVMMSLRDDNPKRNADPIPLPPFPQVVETTTRGVSLTRVMAVKDRSEVRNPLENYFL